MSVQGPWQIDAAIGLPESEESAHERHGARIRAQSDRMATPPGNNSAS